MLMIATPVVARPHLRPGTLILYDSTFTVRQIGSAYPARIAARRGMLAVPENRANRRSPTVTLGFWIIPTTAQHPAAPILYLSGGPGHANIDSWTTIERFRDLTRLRAVADVILLDQRGSGTPSESLPSLQCPEPFTFPLDQPWRDIEQVRAGLTAGIKRCAAYFSASGRDLRGYSFMQVADDIEDLRKALRLRVFNVWGYSAGSTGARYFAQQFPNSVDHLAIGGIQADDIDNRAYARAMRLLATGDREADLSPDPALASDLEAVLSRLDAAPVDVETVTPDGHGVTIRIGAYDVLHQIGWATTELPIAQWTQLSVAIHAMARGDFGWIAPRAAVWRLGQHRSLIEGKLAGILEQCAFRAETPPRPSSTDIFDRFEDFSLSFACDRVLGAYIGPRARDIDWRVFNGPTLIYNGDRDVQTPVTTAMAIKRIYPNAESRVLTGQSHMGVSASGQTELLARFFATPR